MNFKKINIILLTAIFFMLPFTLLQAQSQLDSLKKILMTTESDSAKISILQSIANETYKYDTDTTIIVINEALEIAKNINDEKNIADLYMWLAYLFNQKGDKISALNYNYKALEILQNQKNKDYGKMGKLFNNLAYIYDTQGDIPKALKYYEKAIKNCELAADSISIARYANNIVILYDAIGDTLKSKEYLNKILKIQKDLQDSEGMGITLRLLGILHIRNDNLKKALENFNEALAIQKKQNDYKAIGMTLMYIAVVQKLQKDYETALTTLNKAHNYLQKTDYQRGIGQYYKYTAEIYYEKNELKKAEKYAQKALDIAKERGYISRIKIYSELLSKIYKKQNKWKKAFEMYELSKAMQDTLNYSENQKLMYKQQFQYEYEKKSAIDSIAFAKEIEIKNIQIKQSRTQRNHIMISLIVVLIFLIFILKIYREKIRANNTLRKQKAEIQAIADELTEANATKDKFFSIIAHDLRTPFNVILGFGSLLYENIEKYNNEEIKSIINNIYKSAEQTFNLLTNLLLWARKQKNNLKANPEKVKLKNIITKNFKLLEINAKEKNISLIYNGNEDINVLADKEMLNTILRNLISNAIKFTENGEIKVTAEKQENMCKITVADTGIGIKPEKLKNIFNYEASTITRGTAGEKGVGLGLELCKNFVEMNKGKISAKSTPGKGTSFIFTLPLFA